MKKTAIISSMCLLLAASLYSEEDLLGKTSQEEILKAFPQWKETVDSYLPDLEAVEKLSSIGEAVQIEIFLGTWCPDCHEHVSSYFKILEMANNTLLETTYTGIPRDKDSRKPYIKGKDILKVPTFIVYRNNKEMGRIIEHPKESIEKDLVAIIFQD